MEEQHLRCQVEVYFNLRGCHMVCTDNLAKVYRFCQSTRVCAVLRLNKDKCNFSRSAGYLAEVYRFGHSTRVSAGLRLNKDKCKNEFD